VIDKARAVVYDGGMTDVHNDIMVDEDFDTILSEDIDFSGTINFEKSLLVRGTLSGKIDAHGVLLIDAGAVVKSDINADKVIIRGDVKGNVLASQRVDVEATGRLAGNVTSPQVMMETGCKFNGMCTMDGSGD
jgi:cytoskeletal protein CcmA (bactofilin family)